MSKNRGVDAERNYSKWRYGLQTDGRYCIDVDFVEWRGDVPVALIDIKQWPTKATPAYWRTCVSNARKPGTANLHRGLAKMLGIQAYHVFINWTNGDVVMFELEALEVIHTNLDGYEKWLTSL